MRAVLNRIERNLSCPSLGLSCSSDKLDQVLRSPDPEALNGVVMVC